MSLRATVAAVVCVLAVTLAAQNIRVPTMPPRFTATIDYVEVDARVLDRSREPIRGLEAKDFTVLEDGVQQALSVFSVVDLPRPVPGRPGVPVPGVRPDVAVNTAASDTGRTYLIVIDSSSIRNDLTLPTRKLLRDFVERSIGPDDRVGLATTGRDRAYENFTGDKARLLAAIGRMFGQSDGSPTVVAALDITNRALAVAPDPGGIGAGGGVQRSGPVADGKLFDARTGQRDLVRWIQAMSTGNGGSKAIILVSEGVPYDTVSNTEGLKMIGDLEQVSVAARRGNIPIYPVDPRGLTSGEDEGILAAVAGGRDTATSSPLLDEVRRAHDRMRALADDSGGAAILDVNDLPRGLDRVVGLSSSYYVLGYYSTNTKRDGKYHRISVNVDRPGATVLARHGYTAPSTKAVKAAPLPGPQNASLELRQALNAPLPVDGLTMAATAAAFRSADARKVSVSVVVEAQGTDPGSPVEMAAFAMTPSGAIRDGEFGRVDFSASAGTGDRVKQFGFRWLARLNDLKPGRYQIRGAVSSGSRQGSVWYDLDVPDFSKAPLSMSDLLLASVVATQRVTVRPDKLLGDALPAPPTTLRVFLPADTIAVYAEAYDNDAQHPHEVETSVFITNDRGEEQSRSAETRTAVNGVLRLQARLPLATLAPGQYTLAAEVRQTAHRAIAAGRAVPFQVVTGGNR
jgi:VWFA-related protein